MGMIFLKYHEYNPWIKTGLQGKLGYTAFPLRGENLTTALARTGQRRGAHRPFPRRESSRTRISSCLRLLPSSSLKGKRGISTGARHSLLAQSKTLGPHRLNAQENVFCRIPADRKRILREEKHSASVYKQAVKQKLGVSCFPTLLARREAPGRD